MPDFEDNIVTLRVYKKDEQPPDCINTDKDIVSFVEVPINSRNRKIMKNLVSLFAEENYKVPLFHMPKPEGMENTEVMFYDSDYKEVTDRADWGNLHIQGEKEGDPYESGTVVMYFFWRYMDPETEEFYESEPLICADLHETYGINFGG